MICFCYFCQKKKIILGMAHNDLFPVQIGSKKQFWGGFTSFFENC